jgi:hypothetical protein
MQTKLAQFIIQACENGDTFFQDEDSMPELRESYSGRGMFGKETTAIVCSDLMAVMAAIACETVERLGYDTDTEDEAAELANLLESIRHLQTDSIGRSSIVIY